ncbi:hypothetical protein C350_03888 [Cryptococcus neoformans MW-RSA36]|nr:hypothetical protein C350_03888 [Cryptococcus neoformans var. grubii MW-RSA36]
MGQRLTSYTDKRLSAETGMDMESRGWNRAPSWHHLPSGQS